MYSKYMKRILDIFTAGVLFLCILPIFVVLMLLTRICNGRGVFFKQKRSGLNKTAFYMLKFRSMTEEKDSNGILLPDEKRLTKWGEILRSTSLDELPELINIIKGDMSVIGPRPLPTEYNDFYRPEELKRFEVRGGLIPPGGSLAMNAIVTWDKQFEYESWYAENVSFMLDIKILFRAFKILFQRNSMNYGEYVRQPLSEERMNEKG